MNAVQKLRQLVGEIRDADPARAKASWELAGRLLSRQPVRQDRAAQVCAERDVDALDALVAGLENPGQPAPTAASAAGASPEVSEAEQDRAFRAFKKRLKLARLADESKLGGRQLSGGRSSEIDAIIPPTEFAPEVWQALAKSGRLKHTGQGFYAMP